MKSLIIGIMVAVSALSPLKGPSPEGTLVGEQPYRDLRLQASFLGEARLAQGCRPCRSR